MWGGSPAPSARDRTSRDDRAASRRRSNRAASAIGQRPLQRRRLFSPMPGGRRTARRRSRPPAPRATAPRAPSRSAARWRGRDRAASADRARRAGPRPAARGAGTTSRRGRSRRGSPRCPAPTPGRPRRAARPAAPCAATSRSLASTLSAASRYERMRNGFSPLISSRSAISCRTRASERLSIALGRPG